MGVTRAARTRTTTSFLAMDHVVGMRAQHLAASAARLEISLSGIQSAMRPSAGVQPLHTRVASAPTRGETVSIVAAVQRHAVGMDVRLLAMCAAGTHTQRREASAASLGVLKSGILSAMNLNAGVWSIAAPPTRRGRTSPSVRLIGDFFILGIGWEAMPKVLVCQIVIAARSRESEP